MDWQQYRINAIDYDRRIDKVISCPRRWSAINGIPCTSNYLPPNAMHDEVAAVAVERKDTLEPKIPIRTYTCIRRIITIFVLSMSRRSWTSGRLTLQSK